MKIRARATLRPPRWQLRRGVLLFAVLLAVIGAGTSTLSAEWCLQETSAPSSEASREDASCVTWIVEGMLKSKSGAT